MKSTSEAVVKIGIDHGSQRMIPNDRLTSPADLLSSAAISLKSDTLISDKVSHKRMGRFSEIYCVYAGLSEDEIDNKSTQSSQICVEGCWFPRSKNHKKDCGLVELFIDIREDEFWFIFTCNLFYFSLSTIAKSKNFGKKMIPEAT